LIVFCSTRLMVYWDDHPDSFPAPLRWIGMQVVRFLMPLTAEQVADIEFALSAASSLAIMSGVAWLVLLAVKRLR
jgi:hypothetical protein